MEGLSTYAKPLMCNVLSESFKNNNSSSITYREFILLDTGLKYFINVIKKKKLSKTWK